MMLILVAISWYGPGGGHWNLARRVTVQKAGLPRRHPWLVLQRRLPRVLCLRRRLRVLVLVLEWRLLRVLYLRQRWRRLWLLWVL
jgi:hypothetical protein